MFEEMAFRSPVALRQIGNSFLKGVAHHSILLAFRVSARHHSFAVWLAEGGLAYLKNENHGAAKRLSS